jgi:hypothetical protein
VLGRQPEAVGLHIPPQCPQSPHPSSRLTSSSPLAASGRPPALGLPAGRCTPRNPGATGSFPACCLERWSVRWRAPDPTQGRLVSEASFMGAHSLLRSGWESIS